MTTQENQRDPAPETPDAAEEGPLAPEPEPHPGDGKEEESGADSKAETEEPSGEIQTLRAELEKTRDQMLRAMAEAENARKRAAREKEDSTKYAISGFARDLLDVADNMRRALDAAPEETGEQVQGLIQGVEATEREMLKIFEKHGIRKIEPMGEIFDPNYHEVMFETPGTGQPPGTIIQVLETGYVLNGRLLRPARVGVAKDDGENAPPSSEDNRSPGGHVDTEA